MTLVNSKCYKKDEEFWIELQRFIDNLMLHSFLIYDEDDRL